MILWHRSFLAEPIGTHLLPISRLHPDDAYYHRVAFHEYRELANRWGCSPRMGHTLYRANSADLPELEKHPIWVGVWWTREPVSFEVLEVVTRHLGDAPAGLIEQIKAAALSFKTA